MESKLKSDNTGVIVVLCLLVAVLGGLFFYDHFISNQPTVITVCQTTEDFVVVTDDKQIFRGQDIDALIGKAIQGMFVGLPGEKKTIALKVIPQQIKIVPRRTTSRPTLRSTK